MLQTGCLEGLEGDLQCLSHPEPQYPDSGPLTHVMTCETLQSAGRVVRTRTRVKSWILEKADENFSDLCDEVIPKYSTDLQMSSNRD